MNRRNRPGRILTALSALTALVLSLAVLAACAAPAATSTPTPAATATPTPTPTPDIRKVALPLADAPTTFTALVAIDAAEGDLTGSPVWKRVAETTNVGFAFECVVAEEAAARFDLVFSSKAYPDFLVPSAGVDYPGGWAQAVDDGVLVDLAPLLPTAAPLYWSLLDRPEVLRDIVTDQGTIPLVHQVVTLYKDAPSLLWGMAVRNDWLKADGLGIPQTIDDWYVALKAFKEKNGAKSPLLWHLGDHPIFLQAYGVLADPASRAVPVHRLFYPDDAGTIRFGGVEPAYRDYLATLSQWYAEGLYDPEFATRDLGDVTLQAALVAEGRAGAAGGYYAAWAGHFLDAAKGIAGFEWVAAPVPRLDASSGKATQLVEGSRTVHPSFGAITTACEDPALLLGLMNYLCTEEGLRLANYGIEGDTYTLDGGQVLFTEKVLKAEAGPRTFLERYIGPIRPFRPTGDENIVRQLSTRADLDLKAMQLEAVDVRFLSFGLNADERQRLDAIMGAIRPYVQEQYRKAVQDPAVAAVWMEVQASRISELGIAEAIGIVQGAYDRHQAKGGFEAGGK